MNKKRIPTLLGLLLTFIGLGVVIVLVQLRTSFLSKADITGIPKNIIVSNLKDNQFSLFWTTDKEIEGFISYGESQSLGNIAYDRRDQSFASKGKYITHYINISGLEGGKSYYFKIGSGADLYGGDLMISRHCQDYLDTTINGPAYKIIMPNSSGQVMARMTPVSGSIISDEQTKNPAAGSIVCLQTAGLLPLSDLTSNVGSFLMPLVSVLKQDLTVLDKFPDDILEEINIVDKSEQKTFAKVKSINDHPIPVIAIGKTYDFSINIVPTASPTPNFEISSPSGQISDTMPTFRGKGSPGQNFEIKIESDHVYQAQVRVDENGAWVWTPPGNLSPGEHTVTITAKDEAGNIQNLVKTFTVLGINPIMPAFAGTPSATLAPTATLIPTPTEIPTIIPTAIPTTATLPETASDFPYIVFLTIGLISITLGIGLSFRIKR